MSQQQTKKEKREAARKARIEEQKRRERARKRKRMMVIGSIVAVAILAGYLIFVRSVQDDKLLASAKKSAGCSDVKSFKIQGQDHIPAGAPDPKYNSNPPTSGPHLGSPGPWGSQDSTVDKKILVHNLEHGGVVIHHKGLSSADSDKVAEIADSFDDGVISQPNKEIKTPVAVAAWGKLQTCKKVSERVIKAFVKEHCNKGPEKFALQCG